MRKGVLVLHTPERRTINAPPSPSRSTRGLLDLDVQDRFKRSLSCRQIHSQITGTSIFIAAVNVYPYPVKPQTISCSPHRNAEDVEPVSLRSFQRIACEQDEHLMCSPANAASCARLRDAAVATAAASAFAASASATSAASQMRDVMSHAYTVHVFAMRLLVL